MACTSSRYLAGAPLNGAMRRWNRPEPLIVRVGGQVVELWQSFDSRRDAVAVTYNGGTYAVMMATPQDLEEFALAFSLSEGVITSCADIDSLTSCSSMTGSNCGCGSVGESRSPGGATTTHGGTTGCGLCGIESIAEAMRPAATIGHGGQFSPEQIMAAMESLPSRQRLNIETRAVHAAAFGMSRAVSLRCARTLVVTQCARQAFRCSGACVHRGERGHRTSHQPGIGGDGAETAAIGAPAMVSVSAPTALAVRMRMQRVSHLPPSRGRTDSRCSPIRVESHRSRCWLLTRLLSSNSLLRHYLIQRQGDPSTDIAVPTRVGVMCVSKPFNANRARGVICENSS